MAPTKVILLSCGSYNPPTNMHLRMFEIARDHLHKMGSHVVLGGVISPVHDAYGKKDLASSTHRCAMLRLALQNNDWIKLSDWETKRESWTKTRVTLQHHQNLLNSWVFDTNDIKHHSEIEDMDWIPDKIKNSTCQDRNPIQVKLLCGADLLESFGIPGLWAEEDIEAIVGQHGLVVVTRAASNPNQFIYDSDLLTKYMHNILIVTEWITNEISSTKIRRALKRGESAKYLVHDSVLDYIYKHEIFGARRSAEIKLELSPSTANNYLNINSKYENTFLTPSPSDITMDTPSPVEIISIDIPDSILNKNLLNSTSFSNTTKISIPKLDDNDLVREKFIGVMSENGNKLLHSMKSAYPGQAKQIIATETGESHILEEVGSLTIKSDSDTSPIPLDKENPFVAKDSDDLTLDKDKDNFLEVTHNLSENDFTQTVENTVNNCSETGDNTAAESQALIKPNLEVKDEDVTEVSAVNENTETIGEANEAIANEVIANELIANETHSEEQIGNCSVNKEALEIDGKYLKSLVNSRKSPKKCKNKDEKLIDKEESRKDIPEVDKPESSSIKKAESVGKIKEDGFTQCEKIDSVNSESQTDLNFDETFEKTFNTGSKKLAKVLEQTQHFVVQGSLDSVKFNVPNERSVGLDSASKKSKSYESIKYDSSKSISYKSFEISLSDTLKPKSDSTSQLITANFCTECCYENDAFIPEVSTNQETFYTVQSNRSSPVEEDSTECDICSACNLDSTEILDPKSSSITEKCDLCEICNDINADFEGDLVMPYAEIELDAKTQYILEPNYDSDFTLVPETESDRFEIENCGLEKEGNVITYCKSEGPDDNEEQVAVADSDKIIEESFDQEMNVQVDNDHFEIENCGLDNKVRSLVVRDSSKLNLQLLKNSQLNFESNDLYSTDNNPREIEICTESYRPNKNVIYASNENVKYSTKLSLPKYVPTISSKGGKKIMRKGSFIINDSSCKSFQDKRRYSSVDNLQHSKQILKLSDRVLQKSKGNKLIASADNIQSNTGKNTILKKLQKSANDIDSLTENFDSSAENFSLSENDLLASDNDPTNIHAKIKIRDSDMVKMILTKHGIKIISEKETAL